jgi:hypothetical protein
MSNPIATIKTDGLSFDLQNLIHQNSEEFNKSGIVDINYKASSAMPDIIKFLIDQGVNEFSYSVIEDEHLGDVIVTADYFGFKVRGLIDMNGMNALYFVQSSM